MKKDVRSMKLTMQLKSRSYDIILKAVGAKPGEPNDVTLLRLCDMHTIPVATNIATAEVLIHGLERGDLAWIELQRGR